MIWRSTLAESQIRSASFDWADSAAVGPDARHSTAATANEPLRRFLMLPSPRVNRATRTP